jgi:hypothetical protein
LSLRFPLEALEAYFCRCEANSKLLRDFLRAGHFSSVFVVDQERGSENLRLMLCRRVRAVLRKVCGAVCTNNAEQRHAVMQNSVGEFMRERHPISPNAYYGPIADTASTGDRHDAFCKLGFGVGAAQLRIVEDNKNELLSTV